MDYKILEEAVNYFKSNHGFNRVMKKIKEKYSSFEREAPGTIVIEKPTTKEKDALSGFMKKDYSRNKSISISLKSFQKRIDETKFSGLSIKQILEKYFGGEIVSNKEQKRRENEEIQDIIENLKKYCKSAEIVKILEKSCSEEKEIVARIKKEYHKDKNFLEQELKKAIKALENLPSCHESLPIFAAKVNGDPHSLDKNRLAGQMFLRFLVIKNNRIKLNENFVIKDDEFVKKDDKLQMMNDNSILEKDEEKNEGKDEFQERAKIKEEWTTKLSEDKSIKVNPKNTEEMAEIYYNNNLLIDEMSNMVLVRNLIALKNGQSHEGWKSFCNKHEPMQVTLYNLSQIDEVLLDDKIKKYNSCFIVENPGVFTNMMQDESLKEIPIVCTYGQVKLAGIILLNKLVKSGIHLYYSGDIDPEGMQIADKLKQRFRENLTLIGFDEETYIKNKSNVALSEVRIKKLDNLIDDDLKKTAELLKISKVAAYEELNTQMLKKIMKTGF